MSPTSRPPRPAGDGTDIATADPTVSYGLRLVVVSGPAQGVCVPIGEDGVSIGSGDENQIVIADRRVSRRHLEIRPHPGGALVRDLSSRNGTYLAGARITEAVVPPGGCLSVVDSQLSIEPDRDAPALPPSPRERLGGLLARSLAMRRLFTAIERVAPTDYTVLVQGETGTGKEVVARAIHELSPRQQGPLVVFDCGAVGESVLDSELFGHVRGAFTGAVEARDGAFRRAHRGTLFIDELSCLPLPLQTKLLRVLETRQVHPVGADEEHAVDIRIVAASNVPLREAVARGQFRRDLFHRMSVVALSLPPLRARLEDVPLLAGHFLGQAGFKAPVEGRNLDRLVGYAWPGNVRELRNTIDRALALAGANCTRFDDLPITFDAESGELSWPLSLDLPFKVAKDQLVGAFERVYASRQLARAGGNISRAARSTGLSRRHFFDLLKKHGLLPPGSPPE